MYADDIVLLSETEDELRNCLEKLMAYNEKWHLKLNHKKTKTMIFQAKYKKKLNIILNGHPLEEVKQFKYLGNIITNTGNFKQNDNYLKLKGQRASYQIMKVIGKYMKPSKSLSLFEKIVEPILLYNCEITTAYIPQKWTYKTFMENMWNKNLEIDKVLKNYTQQKLGVSKKTSYNGRMR